MAYILHIDTSSEKAVMALSHNGKVSQQKSNAETRNHAAAINRMVEEILNEEGIKLEEINAYSVIGGPGSYTGLRIGLSTAKAFCYVFDKPLILINKLELLALQTIHSAKGSYDYYMTILSAREKEYFMCLYNNDGKIIREPAHVFEADLTEMFRSVKGKMLVSGLSQNVLRDFENNTAIAFAETPETDISFWCIYSQELYAESRFADLAHAEPFYLKEVYTFKKT